MKVIITGVTGYVGQGILLESLKNVHVTEVLAVGRRLSGISHPKLKELLVEDFMNLSPQKDYMIGYDACFYCAGISANGLNEEQYSHIIFDMTINFANTLVSLNPEMTFIYLSGQLSDSTEKGNMMWARVKGKTENTLMKIPFKNVYNFRPGMMKEAAGQNNVNIGYQIATRIFGILSLIFTGLLVSMKAVSAAMVNAVLIQPEKTILEVKDIKTLAKSFD